MVGEELGGRKVEAVWAMTTTSGSVRVSATLSGDASDFGAAAQGEAVALIADRLRIDEGRITNIAVSPGSFSSFSISFDITNGATPAPPLPSSPEGVDEVIIIAAAVGGMPLIIGVVALAVLLCRGDGEAEPCDLSSAEAPKGQLTEPYGGEWSSPHPILNPVSCLRRPVLYLEPVPLGGGEMEQMSEEMVQTLPHPSQKRHSGLKVTFADGV